MKKQRVTALKELLRSKKIDYFILPNSDEFFSEYLPEHEKRIEYLTGFTGSNALIIFGQEKSYFFTDGRYILQARNELDLAEFEIINIANKDAISWMAENIKEQKTIAFYSKVLSLNFINKCKSKSLNLTALEEDFIDQIWTDRKIKNNAEIFLLNDKVSGKNSFSKRQEIIQNSHWDFLVISDPQSLCWLLNIRSSDVTYTPLLLAYGFLFKDGSLDLFIDEKRLTKNLNLEKVNIIHLKFLSQRITQLEQENRNIQTDPASTNYWINSLLEKSRFQISYKTDPILLPKSCKNSAEIFGAIKSHEIDGLAVTKFLYWLENNQETNELEAEEKLLEFRKESPDFLYPSFRSISGFGSNGAIIHYHSEKETNKKFTKNSLYLIDSGGQYLGEDFAGTTDITRTIVIGKPSAEMIEDYTRVLKGHIALARIKFPKGTSGAQLDVLARSHLWQAKKNYDHGTGHGVGSFLSVHEGPCGISKNSHQELIPGMILSNEPGFYKEGEYGIRIENLMLVQESDKEGFLQFKTITLAPLDLRLIDFKMLTYPEKKWLKNYHEEINKSFANKLSDNIQKWLLDLF